MGIDNEDEFGPDLTIDGTEKLDASTIQAPTHPASEYPYEDGDVVVLGPEIFASEDGSVLNWKGRNFVPQKEKDRQPKDLKAYSVGEDVEVQKAGDWLPGHISSKQAGTLNVDTERGPVAVMSYHRIRKAESND